ncbi:2-hydroxychromene-2-carboxylate isomerase [Yoonia sediminilitoris]|uniref:2-hydroxychromene-2-carboxylate isomerase n=1 Tax=Yoonia sediminilitoris TaxID=1286148 RepID=A0A2T6KMU1_9RHOB|nr:2-hydroxychromene-2-carboxylate isomerase [Yoonia sediminilitoris]PUB17540.1 2-hydroxychromene-2-carboxylate isomerase [Yoonia sediminilitoris]RCW97835.1 2-hydroxychromene-2-carboxylate isomerase [Yoonia sediminilitoris]
MPHIDYYFATISPFTYLCGIRPQEIATKNGATIKYKPVDIMALFARTGGTALKDRHPNRQEYRLQDMVRRAKRCNLPLNPKPMFWPTNAAPSAYAIIAAQNAGGGDLAKLVHLFGAACWADERDISQDDTIRDCLTQAGFDPDLADKDMMTSADTFARNLEDAVSAGVFGAPFFITDTDQRFWGEDRLDDLDATLSGTL